MHRNSKELSSHEVAVLIPCLNEASTIKEVVNDFKIVLPQAKIYVYDNNSTNQTADLVRESGAIVRTKLLRGKGNVVRRMFADIEADVYALVDGDATYNAASAPQMIQLLITHELDTVNGARMANDGESFRPGHKIGNRVLSGVVGLIFGERFKDVLSGYRVFSRRFVKSFPAQFSGFEIETELTVHALELRMNVSELKLPYKNRPEGSASKLNTIKDGLNVLRVIITIVKDERPFQFFSLLSAILAITSVILAAPIFTEYLKTGLVPRFPTAILCSALIVLAFLSIYTGLILDTVTTARREMKRLYYMQLPPFQPKYFDGRNQIDAR